MRKILTSWVINNSKTQLQNVKENLEVTSIKIAFDLARQALAFQLEQVDTLDAKANSIQVSAPALIGVDIVLLPLHHSVLVYVLQDSLLMPLLIACGVVMILANNAYKIRNYTRTPKPSALRKYLKELEDYTKVMIYEVTVAAFEKNEKEIDKKASTLNHARVAFNVEIALLVVVLISQVLLFQFVP